MCRIGLVEESGGSRWQAWEASGAQELTGGFLHWSQAPDGQEAPTCAQPRVGVVTRDQR